MIEIRRAKKEDVLRWYNGKPMYSMKGYVAEKDGELLGLGGVFRVGGHRYVFAEMLPEAHRWARSILRIAKKVIEDVGGDTVYAVRQEDEPTAHRFLKHLGFVEVTPGNNLYRRN